MSAEWWWVAGIFAVLVVYLLLVSFAGAEVAQGDHGGDMAAQRIVALEDERDQVASELALVAEKFAEASTALRHVRARVERRPV